MVRNVLAAVLTLLVCSTVHSAEADAKKAMLMQTHWQCSTWASMHDNSAAVEKHFNAGLDAGHVFMDAAIAGTISKEEANRNVPVMVGLTMQGPNKDFVLGRLFESAQANAYDRITKRGTNGLALDPGDYITDKELIDDLSRNQYNLANCDLLL